jgi:glycosyltransferase involved in cell wall biosynthesis
LTPEFARRGYTTDILKIRDHGPYVSAPPEGVRLIEFQAAHVATALPELVRYLRKQPPRAMLCDKDKVNRAALLARWLTGAPTRVAIRMGTTLSVDLADRGGWDKLVQTWSSRYLYRYADAIITPSEGAARDLEALARLPSGSVRSLPNPVISSQMVELANEPVDHPWLVHKPCPVIIAVGELGGRKDFETLLKAFAKLKSSTAAKLMILGRGKRRERLQALARALGIDEDVDLLGFVENPYRYMARADVFALSSRWEGFGIVLIEAMSLGVPCVATDCPSGPREALDQGRLGKLVPVGDDDALASALAATLDEPPPRGRLIEAAQKYSAKNSASAYLAALGLDPRA